jgi:hypothetical protein
MPKFDPRRASPGRSLLTLYVLVGVLGALLLPPVRETMLRAVLPPVAALQTPRAAARPAPAAATDVPVMRLWFTPEDHAHFARLAKLGSDGLDPVQLAYRTAHNLWRDSELEFQGTRHPIRIKAHGRTPYHQVAGQDVSLAIKLRDRGQIEHANRFSLIVYPRVILSADILRAISDELGLLCDRTFPVEVQYAEGRRTRMFFEYRLNNAFMALQGWPTLINPGKDIIGRSAVIAHLAPGGSVQPLLQRLEQALPSALDPRLPAPLRGQIAERLLALDRAIADGDADAVVGFFDRRYLAAFEAVRLLTGSDGHGFSAGNGAVFYDPSSGLFYPVYHRDHFMHPLAARAVLERMPYADLRYPLWELLSRHDGLRQAKYRVLHAAIRDGLPARMRELYGRLARDPRPRGTTGEMITPNAELLASRLAEARPELSWALAGDRWLITLRPGALAELTIDQLIVNGFFPSGSVRARAELVVQDDARDAAAPLRPDRVVEADVRATADGLDLTPLFAGLGFSDGLGPDLAVRPRAYQIRVRLLGAGPWPVGLRPVLALRHALSGAPVPLARPAEQLAVPDASMARALDVAVPRSAPPAAWLASLSSELALRLGPDGALHVPAGVHTLRRDLHLPAGHDLVLDAGAQLRLGPGVTLLVHGGLLAHGSAEAPVVVRALDPARPFATLAAVGDGTTVCELRHLHVSDGNEAFIEGVHLSGSVSLYHHARVLVQDSQVRRSRSDDGMNVKYAQVEIVGNRFEDNFADQLDIDVATGRVEGNHFGVQGAGSSNGDGVDVSFSRMRVADNDFVGLTDKAVSVGELSRVRLEGNQFSANRLAIAVKDGSKAWLRDNRFDQNAMGVFAYKKRKAFGGAEVLWAADSHAERPAALFADEHSAFFVGSPAGAADPFAPDAPRRPLQVAYQRFVMPVSAPPPAAAPPAP